MFKYLPKEKFPAYFNQ